MVRKLMVKVGWIEMVEYGWVDVENTTSTQAYNNH